MKTSILSTSTSSKSGKSDTLVDDHGMDELRGMLRQINSDFEKREF